MTWNWRALAPHRPLLVAEMPLYEPRPGRLPEMVASRLEGGLGQPIALFGPVGSGKSTELAAVARVVRDRGALLNILTQLDREIVFDARTTPESVLEAVAIRVVRMALDVLHLPLSEALRETVRQIEGEESFPGMYTRSVNPRGLDFLRLAVREVAARSRQGRVAILLDGLEKVPRPLGMTILTGVAGMAEEAGFVVVVPISFATGPEAAELTAQFTLLSVSPVVVDDAIDASLAVEGRAFLLGIAARRLDTDTAAFSPSLRPVLERAAVLSGGVPRTFLQLLQEAAGRALMRGSSEPDTTDLAAAAREQADALFRLLTTGDAEVIRSASGKAGNEIEVERRVRLLSHGLLLEYRLGDRIVLHPGPLVLQALAMVGA